MIGFNHALAGAIIAIAAPAPFQPLLAFLSHFLLDMFPHFGRHLRFSPWTSDFKKLLLFDALMCFLVLFLAIALFPANWWLIVVCTAAATLPDFLWPLEKYAPDWMKPFYTFHKNIQWGERPYGWIFELFYFLAGIAILYFLVGLEILNSIY